MHVILGVIKQSSAFGMTLYSTYWYSNHLEFIHGCLAISIVCHAMSYTLSSYITMFSLALSFGIGLMCFHAFSYSMPINHHGRGFGGAIVVIMCTGMVPRARKICQI